MIAQTSEFPTISTMTNMERTVVMAIVAESNMIDERQCRDLNKEKTKVHESLKISREELDGRPASE